MFRYIVRRLLQMVLAFFGDHLDRLRADVRRPAATRSRRSGRRDGRSADAQRAYLTEQYHLDTGRRRLPRPVL